MRQRTQADPSSVRRMNESKLAPDAMPERLRPALICKTFGGTVEVRA